MPWSRCARMTLATNVFYCDQTFFVIAVTDQRRSIQSAFLFRLNILADVPRLPPPLQGPATQCNSQLPQ